ncbi:MAG: RNHCP domain-containing protein [Bacilli bacterium]|nr:RNHCP domain-containing protein [Bacilli bacterium]
MKRFNMIDENFICENCGAEIKALGYTARDHCPFCLYSKHVDVLPGDREASCGGLLEPIATEHDPKHDYKIVYKCEKCHMIKKNIMAKDDNLDLIIKISSSPINY